jgi:hypothetical protein
MNDTEHLLATAYHEAGHAVMSVWLGYKVMHATIVATEDKRPHVECDCPDNSEAHIKIAMASSVCQRAFNIDGGLSALLDANATHNAVEHLLPNGTDEEQDVLLDQLWAETEVTFIKPSVRSAVEALVAPLLRHFSMDGVSVHAILDPILAGADDRPVKA